MYVYANAFVCMSSCRLYAYVLYVGIHMYVYVLVCVYAYMHAYMHVCMRV